jgi:hypothetical protein
MVVAPAIFLEGFEDLSPHSSRQRLNKRIRKYLWIFHWGGEHPKYYEFILAIVYFRCNGGNEDFGLYLFGSGIRQFNISRLCALLYALR